MRLVNNALFERLTEPRMPWTVPPPERETAGGLVANADAFGGAFPWLRVPGNGSRLGGGRLTERVMRTGPRAFSGRTRRRGPEDTTGWRTLPASGAVGGLLAGCRRNGA